MVHFKAAPDGLLESTIYVDVDAAGPSCGAVYLDKGCLILAPVATPHARFTRSSYSWGLQPGRPLFSQPAQPPMHLLRAAPPQVHSTLSTGQATGSTAAAQHNHGCTLERLEKKLQGRIGSVAL